jgi:hypothetical protein
MLQEAGTPTALQHNALDCVQLRATAEPHGQYMHVHRVQLTAQAHTCSRRLSRRRLSHTCDAPLKTVQGVKRGHNALRKISP